MRVTYLRDSVVWLPVKYFFLKCIRSFVQLCKNFVQKPRLIPCYLGAVYASAPLFLECASAALVYNFKFWTINDDF